MTFPSTSDFWSETRVEALKVRIAAGDSYSTIAKALGCTRNAVAGKASRKGFTHPASAKITNALKNRPADKVPAFLLPKPGKRTVQGRVHHPLPTSTPKVLALLNRCECRWPVGEDPGCGNADRQLFCAAVTDDGVAYCGYHTARSLHRNRSPEEKALLDARAANARANKSGHFHFRKVA